MKRFVVVVLCIALLAACGDGDDDGAAGDAGPVETTTSVVEVEIVDFAFQPDVLTVADGGVLTVVNRDDVTHALRADDGSFRTGELAEGESDSVRIEGSGTLSFRCEIHDSMTGEIDVV